MLAEDESNFFRWPVTQRKTFSEGDVKRALKAVQSVGLTINRVEIDLFGKIVIVSGKPLGEELNSAEDPSTALVALRKKIDERRSQRLASRQENTR